jgi:hypothetical protein
MEPSSASRRRRGRTSSTSAYLIFVLKFILVFGLGFLLPVFLVGLNVAHILPGRLMLRAWRGAVFMCFLFTAVMTPDPNPWTMVILAVPLVMLYFAAVGVSLLLDRRRARSDPSAEWLRVADDEAFDPARRVTHFTGRCAGSGLYANPVSGRGRSETAAAQLRGILADSGHIVLTSPRSRRRRAGAHLRRRPVRGHRRLGRRRRRRHGQPGANACAGTDIPVVLPAGTGNDNARSLGMPRKDIPAIARLISDGQTRRIDAGRCVTADGELWWLGSSVAG